MSDKETTKEEIRKLIEKYNRLVDSGKLKTYNEEMTKRSGEPGLMMSGISQ